MFLVVLACLAFVSIALPDSMLGVAWPSMRVTFEQPTGAAGIVPPFGVAAGMISTSVAGYLVARVGVGRLLAGGTLLATAALGVSAASATFWQFLISVVLLGLASGAVDATLNAYAARTFGPRRINLLHASYGVGAATSPLIVTAVITSGSSWRLAYVIVAILLLASALTFMITHRRWAGGDPAAHGGGTRRGAGRVWTVDTWIGLVAVVVQTGIESATALWAYTFLTGALDVAPVIAGSLASGYWLTMVIGRVICGSVAERIGAWPMMSSGVGGLLVAGVLVNLGQPAPALAGIVLTGLATAPIYPLLILTTAERTSPEAADRVVGFQAAASSFGAALLPGLIGLAMSGSIGAFAPAFAAMCVVAAGLHIVLRLRRRARRR